MADIASGARESEPKWTKTAPYPWTYLGGGVIADARGKPTIYLAGRLNDGNADAIGRLAAAAPEFFEALDLAYRCLTNQPYDGAIDVGDVLIKARAALAKAAGGGS